MTAPAHLAQPEESRAPGVSWSDERLVKECLRGNEAAWSALIEKYKRLIYSIPIKYRASREDAADVFQAVCMELFCELPKLRKAGSLRSWLISVTAHKAFHWKEKQKRRSGVEDEGPVEDFPATALNPLVALIEEVEEEQLVREAVLRLPPRCREMVQLLFFQDPPVAYAEVARRLGLATGSIGFLRGRCLKHLQGILEKSGF